MIDFHTHILPGIDDGSTSVQESCEMIKILKKQGASGIVLTPHFYAYKTDVQTFLETRNSALNSLIDQMQKENLYIDLYLAAEVLYFDELWRVDNLKRMCICGTSYIMIEMPFMRWTESMLEGIGHIISRGLNPIIVHFERYLKFQQNMDPIFRLIDMGAMIQMNTEWFKKPLRKRKAIGFIKKGMVSLIGTDCHDLEKRAPYFKPAWEVIEKYADEKIINMMLTQQNMVIGNAIKAYDSATKKKSKDLYNQ